MDEALSDHRIRYRMRGFPIYDKDELVGFIDEDAWDWDALTAEQQSAVRQEAVRVQNRSTGWRGEGWDTVFPFMLDEYGIRCPHKWENRESTFRECRWCRAMEPLPGRIVRVGDQTMRVPDSPPPTLKVPVPTGPSAYQMGAMDDLMLTVTEYRWTGSRYVLAD